MPKVQSIFDPELSLSALEKLEERHIRFFYEYLDENHLVFYSALQGLMFHTVCYIKKTGNGSYTTILMRLCCDANLFKHVLIYDGFLIQRFRIGS